MPASGSSLLIGHLGAVLVIGGTLLFLFTLGSMALGRYQTAGRWTFVAGCLCVLGAMASLLTLFLTDQFQFEYVTGHSWRDLAPMYKVAAVWSGQEGSFLLWATTSSVFGLLAFWRTGKYQRWFLFAYALFLGSICGILAYETPFGLIKELFVGGVHFAPPDGQGLNASLQNYWVVVHPPTIFTGFGSLTVLFAFAVSAMLTGDAKDWIARVRPWALISLSILGLGLVMGGLWAYETQGWGGFWAWDPVENVSFVPWIFVAAFVHGIIVQTNRGRWHGTNFLLGGLPFLLFVYGTFLTRSGFLSKFSVHSFAEMNKSALWILMAFMILVAAAFVTLWATRGRRLGKADDAPLKAEGFNREKAYQSGVIFLSGLATAVAFGMSVPFFVGLAGGQGKVVDEPLYHSVVVWFFVPIMALMGSAPFLSWRRVNPRTFWIRVINISALTLGAVGVMMAIMRWSDYGMHSSGPGAISFPFHILVPRFGWVMCLFAMTAFAAIGNLWRLVELFGKSKLGIGGVVAHIGVATTMAGLVLSRGLEQKSQFLVAQGMPGEGLGYAVAYRDMTSDPMSDRGNKVDFDVVSTSNPSATFTARPGFFFVPGDDGTPESFTWPHIQREATHDVYMSLGKPQFTLWDHAVTLRPGQTYDHLVKVTYVEPTMHGKAAQPGTRFGAKIRVEMDGKSYTCEPYVEVGQGPGIVRATPSLYAYIDRMDASDRSVDLQLAFVHPVYPIELFYKPMTWLVWIGTGILTLGGLLSAFYRRFRPRTKTAENPLAENVETEENAPVPVA